MRLRHRRKQSGARRHRRCAYCCDKCNLSCFCWLTAGWTVCLVDLSSSFASLVEDFAMVSTETNGITAYLVACLLTSLRGPPRAPMSLVAVVLASASVGRGATFILSRVANLVAPPDVGGTFARSRVGGRGMRSRVGGRGIWSGPFQASRPAAS